MNAANAVLLLVEDDPNDVLFFERALAKCGQEVPLQVARDGLEALDYLAGQGPFQDRTKHPLPVLIVLDLKLPNKSGLEVLEWLRGQPDLREIPVVVLTSSREPGDIARAHELGVEAYEVKPVRFTELALIVASIWRRWEALSRRKMDRSA
jgi:CheY-like chemotaxis protein